MDKPNFSEIGRPLGVDRRMAEKYYMGVNKKERKNLLSNYYTQVFYYKDSMA